MTRAIDTSQVGTEAREAGRSAPTPTPSEVGGLVAIISDDEIARVHGHSNFGSMAPRDVVNDGVRKYAIGFQGGWTQLNILLEHGLITTPRPGSYDANLTKKGKKYARAIYQIDKAKKAEAASTIERLSAELARAREALEPFAGEADDWDESVPDATVPRLRWSGDDGGPALFSVGDLRAARAALAASQPEKTDE